MLSLLNPTVILEIFVVISAQQFLVSSVVSVINAFVMRVSLAFSRNHACMRFQPLLLKMPSVYYAVEGSVSNPKTLVNALRSDDHFLKVDSRDYN